MSPSAISPFIEDEYPPKADLRKDLSRPLPVIALDTMGLETMRQTDVTGHALAILDAFNKAVCDDDADSLAACFYTEQAYWRDLVAMTAHFRTFTKPNTIANSFLETIKLRHYADDMKLVSAIFVAENPELPMIDCRLSFRTESPGATCNARSILLPVQRHTDDGSIIVVWKIWILTTWIQSLDIHPEDERLLHKLGRNLSSTDTFETDVLIVGAGNSGLTLAARLKAVGVESVMIDKSSQIGQNWSSRYDSLSFHGPTASCEMPYLRFGEDKQTPHFVTKDEAAEHLREYVAAFNLNTVMSATILSTVYDKVSRMWTMKIKTPDGIKTAKSRELVQATGVGVSIPRLPPMLDTSLFQGTAIHSTQYRNGNLFAVNGAKSAIVIGAASTGFDVLEDCYNAGLQTTIVARSPPLMFPIEYATHKNCLGAYETMPSDVVDNMFMTMPIIVGGEMLRGLCSHLVSLEPDRYECLKNVGFPVKDLSHPDADFQHYVLERAGGHYVDTGEGVRLISERKVGIKVGVEPVAYTKTGLRFSDGSTLDADLIVWCTGFSHQDARATVSQILGGFQSGLGIDAIGPDDLAVRMDATWSLDAEGEVRGMWKRHLQMDNFWVMGGGIQQMRFYSRMLAQQIRMSIDHTLPPAYRASQERLKKVQ